MAALSRGCPIAADNVVGLQVGRALATWSWPKCRAYFEGTALLRD